MPNHKFSISIGLARPLSSTVEVPITVKNRHTPIFAEQFYAIEIPEDIELGSVILDVEADSPTGKKIIYSISGGNVYGEFDIHFSLGEFRISKICNPLFGFRRAVYSLNVIFSLYLLLIKGYEDHY